MTAIKTLMGDFTATSLEDVLQVTSLSRQCLTLRILDGTGVELGAVRVKSGMALQARCGEVVGKDAFLRILAHPDKASFEVTRDSPPETTFPEPIGPIDVLLLDYAVAQDEGGEARTPSESLDPASELPTAGPTAAGPSAPPVAPIAPVPASVAAPRVEAFPEPPPAAASGSAERPGTVLAFASPKGGVGKTTIAVNTAVALARKGHSVLLVDADPQGSIAHSLVHMPAGAGAHEALAGLKPLEACILATKFPGFSVLPSGRLDFQKISEHMPILFDRNRWRAMLHAAAAHYEVVLVDTPAGMFGHTAAILAGCDVVFGVMQSEPLSLRSFPLLADALQQIRAQGPGPSMGGIILNMVQFQDGSSFDVLKESWSRFPAEWLMQTVIPRDPLLLQAVAVGVPLALLDSQAPPASTALFDHLASDIEARAGIRRPAASGRPTYLWD